jgi:hypothetical protein
MALSGIDYEAPAELFLRGMGLSRRNMTYRRFTTAAAAIRFVAEEGGAKGFSLATLEVGEVRYEKADILRLYEAVDYPLPRNL